MEKQNKKEFVWHTMEDFMLAGQPLFLWNGKETYPALRTLGDNSWIITPNTYTELWKYKDGVFKDYRWAYVNQDLELTPTLEENKPLKSDMDYSTIPISELKLPKRIYHQLKAQDIDSVEDLIKLGAKGVSKLHKIGTLSFVEINDSLSIYGIDLNNLL